MPMALMPVVTISPDELMVMAPRGGGGGGNEPMLPMLMPAENVPDVAMSPLELTMMSP